MNGSGRHAASDPVSAIQPSSGSTTPLPPCVLFEDQHLLVVNKPPGWNTHAPSPFAGEGIYDWLRHREPRWANLAILHRLDKETSGVIVFGKTALANRSLTEQFVHRQVEKVYTLLTDRSVIRDECAVRSGILRVGNRYKATDAEFGPNAAETYFRIIRRNRNQTWLEARPQTGRTHQIRVHAASEGWPILGDELYGGTSSVRLSLHATRLTVRHPASQERITFEAKVSFFAHLADSLRTAIIDPQSTDCYRVRHGAADGIPGFYADRLGGWLLSEADLDLEDKDQASRLRNLARAHGLKGAYFKRRPRDSGRNKEQPLRLQHVLGRQAPEHFIVRENGVTFEVSFNEGSSVGLFLDQRDNRRRLLTGHVAAGFPLFEAGPENRPPEVLNCFAYTCGFSVCAALGGAQTTSLDLSKKYLEWGRRNFLLNGVAPESHDFIYGDTLDWLRRLAKKSRRFNAVVLDPPTFSQSKTGGVFRAERDYGRLVTAALPVLKSGGVLFASTNAAGWPPAAFLDEIDKAIRTSRRSVIQRHYVPQPPDFPISRAEPAYLKTVWLRVV